MEIASQEIIRVLVVDDQVLQHLNLKHGLGVHYPQYKLTFTLDAQAALNHLYREPVDIVLLDICMPEISGVELLKMIRARYPDLPAVMLIGNSDSRSIVEAMKAGAFDYVIKGGTDLDLELHHRMTQALSQKRLIGQNIKLKSNWMRKIGVLSSSATRFRH